MPAIPAPTQAVATPRRLAAPGGRRTPRRVRSAGADAATTAAPAATSPPLTASVLRATAVSVPPDATLPPPADDGAVPAARAARPRGASPLLHRIPQSRWPDGVPAVMGAHLLASHAVAPLSVSKGPGLDVTPHQFQYAAAPGTPPAAIDVTVHGSPDAAAAAAVDAVLTAAAAAVKARGAFSLAVAGGSVLPALSSLAARAAAAHPGTDFAKWTIALVDERCVPADHQDSNARAARAAFVSALRPAPTFLTLDDALVSRPADAAAEYAGQLLRLPATVLPRAGNLPSFDAILLGIGPDAHVASLFPNAPALAAPADGAWVVPIENSPKPPAARVTLTLPALNAASTILILATGPAKASAVQRALEVQALPGACPAQMVRPETEGGAVRWILDVDAAALLTPGAWDDAKAWPRSAWDKE